MIEILISGIAVIIGIFIMAYIAGVFKPDDEDKPEKEKEE